ncbi:CRISPR-associated helicase Cas3' [Alkaliphilus pronyensis]|uniref:CRISPR-associated helicase Cas3' n=1 Tax=Alkaliphilus pronyensis TaxID=1482732 RepID=UPI001A9B12DF|nr:CRISPR-associated helicase Cas3' [Alkaliphilus pronyensis]
MELKEKDIFVAHFRDVDKTVQTVNEHLLGTAKLARKFSQKINMGDWGELVGLLHDLGKATDLFNYYIKSNIGLIKPSDKNYYKSEHKVDHISAGAQYIFNSSLQDETVKAILSLLILSHHGGLIDCITPAGDNNFYYRVNKDTLATGLNEAVLKCKDEVIFKADNIINSDLMTPFYDHINKLKQYKNKSIKYFNLGLLIRFLLSCLIDADRQDTADFENPHQLKGRQHGEYLDWNYLSSLLDDHLGNFHIKSNVDNVRQEISSKCLEFAKNKRGIFQLTVPTGGGKTLSSLRFALKHASNNKMERIIYVVPFTTIIDQNADTVRKILEKDLEVGTVVLEHHSNLTPEEDTERTKLLSENWDAPIVFTTMVQLLEALFNGGTRSVRRMHQLANSVIIFDEIQSLDVKMVHMFNSAIEFLVNICNSSIVLCTATQPLLNNIEPKEYSLTIKENQKIISNAGEIHRVLKRVEVKDLTKTGGWLDCDIVDLAVGELNKNQNVLVIVNTKKSAVRLMANIDTEKYESYHLSTDMCPKHRMDKLTEMITRLERPKKASQKPIICVSTALIEAGINIDFDVVIRFTAGLDSIVQAAGRCNRNGLMDKNGTLYIVNPADEDLTMLKDIKKGAEETERVLREYKNNPEYYDNDILSPKALESYFKYYFYSRKNEMSYFTTIKNYGVKDSLYSLLSTNEKSKNAVWAKNKDERIILPFSFKSAGDYFNVIDGSTQGVIVPYGDEGKELINKLCEVSSFKEIFQLLKASQQFSVNLFTYQLRYLIDMELIDEVQKGLGIYYLKNLANYDLLYGLVKEPRINDGIIIW